MMGVENEDVEVDDEEEDDGDFKGEHPTVVAVLGKKLIEIVEGAEFGVDGAMPVGKVKAGGDVFVEAREVRIAKEFGYWLSAGRASVHPRNNSLRHAQWAAGATCRRESGK